MSRTKNIRYYDTIPHSCPHIDSIIERFPNDLETEYELNQIRAINLNLRCQNSEFYEDMLAARSELEELKYELEMKEARIQELELQLRDILI